MFFRFVIAVLALAACSPLNDPPVIVGPFPELALFSGDTASLNVKPYFRSDPPGYMSSFSAASDHDELRARFDERSSVLLLELAPGTTRELVTVRITARDRQGLSVSNLLVVRPARYAILGVRAVPKEITMRMGQTVGRIRLDPRMPKGKACFEGETPVVVMRPLGSLVPTYRPAERCEPLRDDRWLILDEERMRELWVEIECDDGGAPPTGDIGFGDCWGLTKYRNYAGPEFRMTEGGWNAIGCGDSWLAQSVHSFHGRRSVVFPKHRIFTDTAKVRIDC